MPHVIVKCYPGRSDVDKLTMAEGVASVLRDTMGYDIRNVSVVVEEVGESDWMSNVYGPDIVDNEKWLVKRPGYGPLAKNVKS